MLVLLTSIALLSNAAQLSASNASCPKSCVDLWNKYTDLSKIASMSDISGKLGTGNLETFLSKKAAEACEIVSFVDESGSGGHFDDDVMVHKLLGLSHYEEKIAEKDPIYSGIKIYVPRTLDHCQNWHKKAIIMTIRNTLKLKLIKATGKKCANCKLADIQRSTTTKSHYIRD